MLALPSSLESKSRLFPSGDQWGLAVIAPCTCVTWVCEVPSAFEVQISEKPVRVLRNAILRPSGEIWGLVSRSGEEVSADAVFSESREVRQMFVSVVGTAQAS